MMKINALVTDKIIADECPLQHVIYCRENDFVSIMVSHSPTWEYDKMRRVVWDDFVSTHSSMNDIQFQEGHWLLSRNSDDSGWDAEKQR
jgi:hypothetical protein